MLSKLKLKDIQSLGQKKGREEHGLFIAEGPRMIEDLLNSGTLNIKEIYALESWILENENRIRKYRVTPVTEIELGRISQLSTPNKVLAIVQQFPLAGDLDPADKIVLALDNISDPGNLGTIIRIADWFGIEHIVCSHGSAEVFNPKVVQATMGSIARINLIYTELLTWLDSNSENSIYGSMLEGKDITTMDKIKSGILIIGNESRGLSPGIIERVNVKVTIPGKGKAESLNAAVATGILLSHLT